MHENRCSAQSVQPALSDRVCHTAELHFLRRTRLQCSAHVTEAFARRDIRPATPDPSQHKEDMKVQHVVRSLACLVGISFGSVGCYHAVIDTGLAPSTQVIDKQWAHGFLYGLVPPGTIETASKCPHGVAKVETQQSFLNQVADILTFGIYTPMQITVTCAATGAMANGAAVVSGPDFEVVLAQAIQESARSGAPVNAITTR